MTRDAPPDPDPGAQPGAVAEPGPQVPFDFDDRLRTAPDRPGVYVMRDREGRVCYVGKAASLRARLRQYVGGQDSRFFVHLLDHVLGAIDLTVTRTEKEALLLENELIKHHQPRFNVRLKDDKRFLHLRLATDEVFPRLQVVRRPAPDGAQYFGPYASASNARSTLQQVNRWFQLRTCPDSVFHNRARPCLEHQIGRCPAPCVLPVAPRDYAGHVKDVSLFLQGRRTELLDRLKQRMASEAESEHFERAGRLRDQVRAIEASVEQQHIALTGQRRSLDAVGLYREGARAAVAVLSFREGVLLGSQGYVLKDQEWPDAEVVQGFAVQLYDRGQPVPDELCLPCELPGTDTLAEWLTDLRRARGALEGGTSRAEVVVTQPQRGTKARVCEMATANAQQVFADRVRQAASAEATLLGLHRRLHLHRLPRRIECYDISNISGTDPTGSMVVALDGALAPKEYRGFAVRSQETPNDFAMMYEVLDRRFQRAKDGTTPWPDLVVIDGGKGQLKMALQALADLGIDGIDVVALAKARTLDSDDAGPSDSSPERVFVPGAKTAIVLPQNSNEVYLLTQLRDEAHRFAITLHRKRRAKRTVTSRLDAIPGVGPARRRALLQAFGSLKAVAAAEEAAIAAVSGVGPEVARRVVAALRSRGTGDGGGGPHQDPLP
ncbi:MAG: excinuclease ABC subunit UvrC [Myxococcales bacterium]|nr:excinuclease ABC subunit UvrC [Myxococcales bacterium]